jgi:hypothetical protein
MSAYGQLVMAADTHLIVNFDTGEWPAADVPSQARHLTGSQHSVSRAQPTD